MNQQDNLWKGLVSYTEEDIVENRFIFSGRSDVTLTLLSMVKNNLLVTLYGKSGIGKTSMLQAGLFQLLRRDNYLPVLLRPAEIDYDNFDSYVIDTVKDQLVKYGVTRYVADAQGRFVRPTPDDTAKPAAVSVALWFASSKFYDSDNREVFPVLVFDQFEALFIGGRDKGSEVLRGLHTMIDDSELQCPEGVVCHNEANFRILLVVREDDLFRLEDAIDELGYNSMKFNRLRLRALTDVQAREVIEKPIDKLKIETGFSLIPDDEHEEAIRRIIDISRNRSGKVDSAILSLVCRELYALANGGVITLALIKQIDKNPLGRFYSHAVSRLNTDERHYIESLVDNRGRRRTVFHSNVDKYIKNSDTLFKGQYKLLQNVPGTKPVDDNPDNQPVELVHDLLAKAVAESKGRRKNIERTASLKTYVILSSIFLLSLSYLLIYNNYDDNITEKKSGYVVADTSGKFSYYGRPDIDSIYVITDSVAAPGSFYFTLSDCSRIKKIVFETPTERKRMRVVLIGCPSLTELVLPDSMITNLTLSVTDCPHLSHIHIAKDVEELKAEINLNRNNPKYNALIIDNDNKNYVYDQGVLWDLQKGIPSLVTHKVSKAYFPDKLKTLINTNNISNTRFAKVDSIIFSHDKKTEITLYPNIKYTGTVDLSKLYNTEWISDKAFAGCKISSIKLPPNLKYINNAAFINCDNLKSIYIPDSVEFIDKFAFADCDKLAEVSVNANTYIDCRAFEGSPNVMLYVRDNTGGTTIFRRGETCWPWKPILNNKYFLTKTKDASDYGKYGIYVAEREIFELFKDKTKMVSVEDAHKFMGSRGMLNTSEFSQLIYYEKGQKTVRFLPVTQANGEFNFWGERPVDLREIYMPYASPFKYLDDGKIDRQYTRRINLDDTLKRNITLYVPAGCSKNFVDIPGYQGFKAIKEMSRSELTMMKILYYINMPEFTNPGIVFKVFVTLAWLIIIAVMITSAYYPISYHLKNVKAGKRILFVTFESLTGFLIAVNIFTAIYLAETIIFNIRPDLAVAIAVCSMLAALIFYYYAPLPRGERMPPWLKKVLRLKDCNNRAVNK